MEEKLNILLCEDDENLGMLLREYLQAKGYNAELCPDGDAGYKAFIKNKYDICVFDVMMPKKDGFTLAKEIRAINSDVPIMFLTAKNLKDDIFEGFKIGADDYITKPFSMEELTLRMEAILRRVHGKKNREVTVYQIGKFTFDAKKQILSIPSMPRSRFSISVKSQPNSPLRSQSFSTSSAHIRTRSSSVTSLSSQSGSMTTTSTPAVWMFTSPNSVSISRTMIQ